MSNGDRALLDAVAAVACELLDGTVEDGADAVAASQDVADARGRVRRIVNGVRARETTDALLSAWSATAIDPQSLALALRAANSVDHRYRNQQQLELVWTGPAPPGTTLRRSDQVLLELVRDARSRLTIVSFAAYRIPSVHNALLDAVARGVAVTFILESRETSGGRADLNPFQAMGVDLAKHATVYSWPFEQRLPDETGARGLLHAKCAIADGARLLISSANFTGAALLLNMELGILVEGGDLPPRVERHFDDLVNARVLCRMGYITVNIAIIGCLRVWKPGQLSLPDDRLHAFCMGCKDEEIFVSNWEETEWADGMMEAVPAEVEELTDS